MTAMDLEKKFGAHNYHPLPVVLARGKGAWLWDEAGRRYLDMMSAYSALSHGHGHPRIHAALITQLQKLTVASRAYYSDNLGAFLQRLCELTGLDMALPMNTGAEAVETAIKAARRWGYRVKGIPRDHAEIIVAENNFHGRTTAIVGFSSDEAYRKDFGPFAPGFKIVPFDDAAALERAITPHTAAVIIEPIQGEAGIIVPRRGYLRSLRDICDRHNVLLILDEIQSGLGRTGKMFAHEHEDILPDGVILGKALGGGVLPVSAFVAKRQIMELFEPGSHGSTFGGNPLSAAVGLEALNCLMDENLAQRSAELGVRLLRRLQGINSPLITDIRSKGLWIGVEFDADYVSARKICELLKEKGILTKETHETVVRLAPPLVIEERDLDWAFDQFVAVVRMVEADCALNIPRRVTGAR